MKIDTKAEKGMAAIFALLIVGVLLSGGCIRQPKCVEWKAPNPPQGFPVPLEPPEENVTVTKVFLGPPGTPLPLPEYCFCGDTVTMNQPGGITINSVITCDPEDCDKSYSYEVIAPDGSTYDQGTGHTVTLNYDPQVPGTYKVVLNASCCGVPCDPCIMYVEFAPQCEEELLTVGSCDNFALPGEATSPSQALLDWIDENYEGSSDTRDCDEDVKDRYWAHTFTGLCKQGCHIEKAILHITVKNKHWNDTLKIGCITDSGDTWEVNDRLDDEFNVAVGEEKTIILDLSNVAGTGANLLSTIESNCFLDVAVDDDSPVDCAVLHIVYDSNTLIVYDLNTKRKDRTVFFQEPTALLIGMCALGAIVLQRRKDENYL